MSILTEVWGSGITAKDLAGNLADMVAQRIVATSAATSTSAIYTVPKDKLLVISSLVVEGASAGVTTIGTCELRLNQEGATYVVLRSSTLQLGFTKGECNLAEELYVPAGGAITGVTTFSAGAAGNVSRLNVVGWLVPIGGLRG